MDKDLLMAGVLALLVVLLVLMLVGWRARVRRQSSLPAPRRVPAVIDPLGFETTASYVATTVAGSPLDRIAVGGLGFRARASVSVTAGGVVLAIPGEHDVWIPQAEIVGVDNATWAIDRVVERDGLVLLSWLLVGEGDGTTDVDVAPVDSYLRFDSPDDSQRFMAAVTDLLTSPATPSPQGGPDQ